ncbi:MAG: glycoside hydrolase family 3 N-terminal domain-containing protein [Bryobacteraceae bacterium]
MAPLTSIRSLYRIILFLASLVLLAAEQTAPARKSAPGKAKAKPAPRPTPAVALSPETRQVKLWMSKMTERQKIAQLLVIPFYGDNPSVRSRLYRQYAQRVKTLGVGGLILVNRLQNGVAQNAEATTSAAFLNRMQRLATVPLIVGADFERGASMRVAGATKFPHAMAFAATGDLSLTLKLGAVTARESRAMGVHWIFAPVADVNNNPDNPIINIRSFSEDPQQVSANVKAFMEGARGDAANRVLVTVKHFPGHGDTAVDTHAGLAKVEASKQRLDELELVPFRAAIEAGVDSVMTAHLWVPSLESQEIPATVSAAVLTDLLRKQLGFKGIITTDAMDMQGLTSKFPAGEPAVRAIEAGADVLLMPANPEKAVNAIAAALRSGRIKPQRIDESLEKVLRAKYQLGLHKQRLVDLESVNDAFDLEEDVELARTVAEKAITLVRNEGNLLPAKAGASTCWFVLSESRTGSQGRRITQEIKQRGAEMPVSLIDPQWTAAEIEEAAKTASSCSTTIVAAFAGYSGNGTLPEFQQNFLRGFIESRPTILVTLGNPYLVRAYPQVKAFLATFSTSQPSEAAAVRAVLGEIPLTGHLPITIPGIAKQGGGLGLTVGGGVR